ncbi:MAG: fasciclin domain-containing protein [bacterium]|nr:fasciclin domain-containing protein [bacterium]
MKKIILTMSAVIGMLYFSACGGNTEATGEGTETSTEETVGGGQSAVKDDESANDIVKVAVGSKDHTTLVAAVKAAELVDVLSNAGPFTVFAPVNAAFDALPAGTVDGLLKPEKKADLQNVLQYHVAVAVYNPERFKDGQKIEMVNGGIATITIKDGKTFINDAELLGNVKASNGIVYVINKVLLPQ